ncbi:hypothetical protein, partial [Staphylococcus pasteuri]|uniref:hypothetical protein n=1 Tax=Staphylococcus pasteuri TaxID=45972 RepID=UPI00164983A9
MSCISKGVRGGRGGLKDGKGGIGRFILLGGRGVGKREVGGGLGECMFGEDDGMIGVDMSE